MSDDMRDIFGEDSDDDHRQVQHQESDNEREEHHDEDTNQPQEDSEHDDEEKNTHRVEADVFGEELDDLSGESDNNNEESSRNVSRNDTTHIEDEDDDQPEQIINAEISKIKTELGKEVYFVKLPNFLSVEPRPFDPEYYEDETIGSDALDEEGKTRIKLKVENTIRWKWIRNRDGSLTKQSNARIVKWSDGSLSMHLGNEIFEVYKPVMQGDHNHLFIRQGTGLQGQAVFRTKLAFRPHSTDSMTHRKMTMSLVDRGSKTQKVKILTDIIKNPEQVRSEMLKKEEERQKAQSRRENQQRRMREKSHAKNISSAYLEDKYASEDEGAISLSAIKSKYKEKSENQRHSIYSSGDESDRERRLNKAKNLDYESDEDRNTSRRKKKVVSDDDD